MKQIIYFDNQAKQAHGRVNQRATKRFRTSIKGAIFVKDFKVCDCLVLDLSATGALVKVKENLPELKTFTLFYNTGNFQKYVAVEVRWRKGFEMGVEMVGDSVTI